MIAQSSHPRADVRPGGANLRRADRDGAPEPGVMWEEETWRLAYLRTPLPEWMEWALRYADSLDPVAPIRKARRVKTSNEGEPQPAS